MPNEVSFESMLGIEDEVPVEDMIENESDVSFDSMIGESSYPGAPGSRKVGYPKPKTPSWASVDEINPKGLDLNQPMFKDTIQGMIYSEFKKPGSVPIFNEPIIDYDKAKKGITESLVGMKELAMNPMEGIRGAASFLADIPGFVAGIAKAAGNMIAMAANGRNLNVSDFYDAASEGMSGAMKDWKKFFTEPLLGQETKASSIIPTIAMSPALVISEYANMLASGKGYENSPNTQGVLRFAGDIGGLVALGSLYKGGRTDATVKTRAIVDKAIEIDKEQKIADANPDVAIKAAQQKIIDAKKIQLELEAKEIMNNLDYGKIIKEDLAGKGERVKQIKQPKKFIVDEVVNKANEKLPEAKKVVEKPIEKPVVETPKVEVPEVVQAELVDIPKKSIDPALYVRYDGEWEGIGQSWTDMYTQSSFTTKTKNFDEVMKTRDETRQRYDEANKPKPKPTDLEDAEIDMTIKDIEKEYGRPIEKISDAEVESYYEKVYKETDNDLAIEVAEREPVMLDTEHSPFRETPESTKARAELFSKTKGVMEDPELFTSKLINDVNRWLDGEEVPIKEVRNGLSELSTRAEEIRDYFRETEDSPNNFENWKEMVSEAASWARKAKRESEGGIELYSGFPVNKAIKLLKDTVKYARGKMIRSVNTNQVELLKDITALYTDNKIDVDLTYSKGVMWKGTGINPKYKFDNRIEVEGVIKADITKHVPLDDSSINSIMFDPPFLVGGGKNGIMQKRFTSFDTVNDMWIMYKNTLNEAFRILKPGGRLITKTQDISQASGGQLWASSAEIYNFATKIGFKPIDRFIYNKEHVTPLASNIKQQQHARKTHSDFWIFEKPKRGYKYPEEGGVKLNMMIPVDQVPKLVKETILGIKNLRDKIVNNKLKGGYLLRNKELFDKTGYWVAKDGKWRYEIDDSKINLINIPKKREYIAANNRYADINQPLNGKLSDFLDAPELYKEFPELKDINIVTEDSNSYISTTKTITIDKQDLSDYNLFEKLTHEIQHAVNRLTGSKFIGTSIYNERVKIKEAYRHEGNIPPSQTDQNLYAYGNYRKSPGEMEARLTTERRYMDNSQRKTEPPWETLDKMLDKEGFDRPKEIGTKLYDIGGATAEGAKQIIDAAKRAKDYIAQSRGMKAFKPMQAAKMLKEELVRTWVDRSGNIRKSLLEKEGNVGYEILQKMYLSKGASARAAMNLKQMQKEVYRGLNKNEKRILDSLIFHNRMVDLAKYKTPKQFKYFKEHPIDESIAYIELLGQLEKLSPEQVADMHNRAAGYFEWMKKPLKDMYESGLISQQEYTDLAAHNYRKLKLVDIFDNRYETKIGDKKRTVYDSGVESLARGKNTDIFESSSEIMALEVFNRAYGRILNNEANKNLLSLAKSDKENPFVRYKESPNDSVPSGWDRVFVFENGERKALYLSPELSKEWIINNPELSFKMSQLLRYASGSQVLRTFATGINWGFALANMARDIMHTWFAARAWENGKWKPIYSPHAPVFALQIARDVSSVFTDALLRKGRYEDYLNEGGGMEFMVHQGRLLQKGRHLEGTLDKIENFLGYFGETSEILTRLAIRERALRKGKKAQEATFIARDYMDFGQGGSIAKATDNALPYLNASIQGSRGIFRAFKDNPLRSTYKLAQFGALVTGIYIAMDKRSPETKKNLQGDPSMSSNLVIPLGDEFGFIDKNGQTRYPYIKIPLDPGQRFFKKFFEASTDKWLGNEIDVSGTVKALGELSPVDVGSLPPTLSGVLGYMTNKDFWLNEDIWKDSDTFSYPNSKQEFNARTPEMAVDIGNLTGLSPERLKYAVGELVPSNTVWAYLAGKGYDEVFGDMPKENKEQHLAMVLSQVPGINRFIGVTNPYSKYSEKIDKVQEAQVIKEFIENRNFDIKVNAFLRGEGVTRQDLVKEAGRYKDRDTYNRLMDRLKFEEGIKTLPEKSFWRRMKGLRMEAKAQVFVDRLNNSTPEEAAQLWKEYAIVARAKGIISPELRKEIGRLRAKQ